MKYDIDDLVLLNMADVGYIRLNALIDHFGDLKKAINAGSSRLERVREIGSVLAEKISNLKKGNDLESEWRLIKKHKVKVLSISDKDYPENLREIYNPPIVLYIKGNIIPEDKNAVALVGSRKASIYGLNTCQRLSGQLARVGVTVVSGLARGIDSAAHQGALAAYSRTLAVLGNGLGTVYPPENERLAEDVVSSGALISEFPMERGPLPQNFPIRNRIISGLSLGTVIVEAARKSGALITATCALEQGREVFAVPGKAGSATSMGTHGLIKNGAKLVDSADDILEELNLELVAFATKKFNKEEANGTRALNNREKKIYNILSDEPVHIDNIIDESNLPAQEVISLLLGLEVKKLIKQLPGKSFIRG